MLAKTHALAGITLAAVTALVSAQTTYHAATCGDDSWSGLSDVCQAPDGPKATIQAAIDAAQSGDIVLVLPGTYTGPGNRNLSFNGKAVALRSRDGAAATTIDLQGDLFDDPANFVTLNHGEPTGTSIEGFTVIHSESESSVIGVFTGVSLVVRGCVFTANQTWGWPPAGGVIGAAGADVVVENCTFHGSTLQSDGYPEVLFATGGFISVLDGDLTVRDCDFELGWADLGGAIHLQGWPDQGSDDRLLIEGSRFSELRAKRGGAIHVFNAASADINGCTFESNLAWDRGASDGSALSQGGAARLIAREIEVSGCTFLGNVSKTWAGEYTSAAGGALMLLPQHSARVTNCLFEGNSVDDDNGQGLLGEGGAVSVWLGRNSGASLELTNCTLAANRAGNAGGGVYAEAYEGTTVLLQNAILYANDGGQILATGGGELSVAYSDVEGGFAGTGNIDADPLFVDPDNGDYRLSAGSPCIDAGDNTAVPLGHPSDLAGEPRFRDDPATADNGVGVARVVDMGAYEFQPGPFCAADFNDDGTRNTQDVLAFLNAWNAGEPTADANADGTLNTQDVLAFLNQWNAGC